MTENTQLLPCPFCGREPKLHEHHEGPGEWFVICGHCDLIREQGWCVPRDEAIAAWNTRISHSLPGDVGMRAESIMNAVLDLPFANTAPIEWDDADWHHVRRALAALTPTTGQSTTPLLEEEV